MRSSWRPFCSQSNGRPAAIESLAALLHMEEAWYIFCKSLPYVMCASRVCACRLPTLGIKLNLRDATDGARERLEGRPRGIMASPRLGPFSEAMSKHVRADPAPAS